MDPVRNPFAPGAGSQPPELAGRGAILEAAAIAAQRVLQARHYKSQILLGLRGTGKTVLLNKIEEICESHRHVTTFIEAPEDATLVELLVPRLVQVLQKLSLVETARGAVHAALRALRSLSGKFKVQYGEVSISVDPEPGVADTGNLEYDLTDLFVRIGEAARKADRAWTLLIDEVQYLNETEFSALIVAMHKISQRNLPVLFFGAGLPQVAALSGEAKSYAERLFDYPPIGPLGPGDAALAIRQPIADEGESIADEALAQVVADTEGYPYFLQELGYQVWDLATVSPIGLTVARAAKAASLRRLDSGFFRVRFDRLTPRERDYVQAMARLGEGPYRSSDVAGELDAGVKSLAPHRDTLIKKGMIYSPAYGDVAFTVPMFDDFLRRLIAPGAEGKA